LEKLVNELKLPGHDCPMNRLIAPAVAGVQQLGRTVEDCFHSREVVSANGGGNGFAERGSTVQLRKFCLQEALHFHITAITRDLKESVVDRQAGRIRISLQQKGHDLKPIFPHGKIEWLAVIVLGAD